MNNNSVVKYYDVVITGFSFTNLILCWDLARFGLKILWVDVKNDEYGAFEDKVAKLIERFSFQQDKLWDPDGLFIDFVSEYNLYNSKVSGSDVNNLIIDKITKDFSQHPVIMGMSSFAPYKEALDKIAKLTALRAYCDRIIPNLDIGKTNSFAELVSKRFGSKYAYAVIKPEVEKRFQCDWSNLEVDDVFPALNNYYSRYGSLGVAFASSIDSYINREAHYNLYDTWRELITGIYRHIVLLENVYLDVSDDIQTIDERSSDNKYQIIVDSTIIQSNILVLEGIIPEQETDEYLQVAVFKSKKEQNIVNIPEKEFISVDFVSNKCNQNFFMKIIYRKSSEEIINKISDSHELLYRSSLPHSATTRKERELVFRGSHKENHIFNTVSDDCAISLITKIDLSRAISKAIRDYLFSAKEISSIYSRLGI